VLTALGLIGVVALIAATGYFVAGEFSFVASRRSRFLELAADGDRKARRAISVHKRLSFMLSGAQLGITITTLVLGFIAEPAIAALISPALEGLGVSASASRGVSIAIALVLATVTQMVFGELAPKNLAIARPESVARALARSTLLYLRIFGPIIRLFDSAANRLLRAVGIEPVEELRGAVSPEELDLIVDSSAEGGHLTSLQAHLLERAINFGELEASEAMVPWNRVVTIGADATAADLRSLMSSTHSRFPVLATDDRVVGIVHAKDLLALRRDEYASTVVADLVHDTLVVPEAAGLGDVLAALRARSTQMAIVIDEYGGPAGVITLEDIVEELVGDIEDEYDPGRVGEHDQVEPGVWSVAATSRPDEIERVTGFDLPDGEYDTVAGLVLDRLEHIPTVGEAFVVDGVVIEVTEMDGYAIQRVKLFVDPDAPDDADDADDGVDR
jgi:CBS domain containing-hemolysin-like protein